MRQGQPKYWVVNIVSGEEGEESEGGLFVLGQSLHKGSLPIRGKHVPCTCSISPDFRTRGLRQIAVQGVPG